MWFCSAWSLKMAPGTMKPLKTQHKCNISNSQWSSASLTINIVKLYRQWAALCQPAYAQYEHTKCYILVIPCTCGSLDIYTHGINITYRYTQAFRLYRIAGMFGRDKVWQITSSKVVGEKKFGECLQLIIILWNGLTSEKVWMV